MARSVKCLPLKQESLILDPRHPCKIPDVAVHSNTRAGDAKADVFLPIAGQSI